MSMVSAETVQPYPVPACEAHSHALLKETLQWLNDHHAEIHRYPEAEYLSALNEIAKQHEVNPDNLLIARNTGEALEFILEALQQPKATIFAQISQPLLKQTLATLSNRLGLVLMDPSEALDVTDEPDFWISEGELSPQAIQQWVKQCPKTILIMLNPTVDIHGSSRLFPAQRSGTSYRLQPLCPIIPRYIAAFIGSWSRFISLLFCWPG
jgi:hypothetical protein